MGKFIKLCSCGHKNPLNVIECENCGQSLEGIEMTDEDFTENTINVKPPESANDPEYFGVCEDCGAHNPSNVSSCQICGGEITSYITREQMKSNNERVIYSLVSFDQSYTFEILSSSFIIGREYEMKEYLMNKPYTSRKQAEISICEDKLYIRNLTDRNTTFINNVQLLDKEQHLINVGDEIGLGGFESNGNRTEKAAFFIIENGKCNE